LCWSGEPTSPGCRIDLDPPRYHVMCPGFHGKNTNNGALDGSSRMSSIGLE
jgi:hypothetical protein